MVGSGHWVLLEACAEVFLVYSPRSPAAASSLAGGFSDTFTHTNYGFSQ